ncbi:MAG: hypothetical protein NC827_00700 [Candidatus Omnitrophica bacterium]|nr:hypothetical protein [Candidatus Omnitrophota bacterium]MCM8801820.1 hypothetical protein [Candidatus Omnitrophota bacterium]
MNRKIKVGIFLCLLFFHKLSGENIIFYNGFEKEEEWKLVEKENAFIKIKEEAKYKEEKGLLLLGEENKECFAQIKELFQIKPSTKYRFSGWYKCETEKKQGEFSGLKIIIYFFDKEGKYISVNELYVPQPFLKEWTFFQKKVMTPENAFKSSIKVEALKNGKFYVDELYLEEIKEKPNEIENGNFEKLLSGIPVGWEFYVGAENSVSVDNSVFHSGTHSIKIVVNSINQVTGMRTFPYAEDVFSIEPDTAYTLSCWVKGEKVGIVGEGVNIRIILSPTEKYSFGEGPEKAQVLVFSPKLSGTFDWQEVKYNFTTKNWHKYCTIHFQLRFTEGTIWYDDIKLEKIGKIEKPEF